jgi:hypothetical protein
MDRTGMTTEGLEELRGPTPSFSAVTWKDTAPKFGLDETKGFHQLPTFSYPVAALPPSFHRDVMKASGMWLDVYRELEVLEGSEGEAARVHLMNAVRVFPCSWLANLLCFLSGMFQYVPCLEGVSLTSRRPECQRPVKHPVTRCT